MSFAVFLRKLLRWLAIGVFLGGMGLLWLNGPGMRWLGPKLLRQVLASRGVELELRLDGSFSAGICAKNVRVALRDQRFAVAEICPIYRPWDLLRRGQVHGLRLRGLRAELQVSARDGEPRRQSPLQAERLAAALRIARTRVIPLKLEVSDIQVTVMRGGQSLATLDSSDLQHAAGSNDIELRLGRLTTADGQNRPAQTVHITWQPENLALDRIEVLPGVELKQLTIHHPARGGPSARAEAVVDAAVIDLNVSENFRDATAVMRSGSLSTEAVFKRFGLRDPRAGAVITGLRANLDDFWPSAETANGSVALTVSDARWHGWTVPALNLRVELQAQRWLISATGMANGSPLTLAGSATLARSKTRWVSGPLVGELRGGPVTPWLTLTAQRLPKAMDPNAVLPTASLRGSWELDLRDWKPVGATWDATLAPESAAAASSLEFAGKWRGAQVEATLKADALEVAARYDRSKGEYSGSLRATDLDSQRIAPWLAFFRVRVPGNARLTGSAEASGHPREPRQHHASLVLDHATWNRDENLPPLTIQGQCLYQYPHEFIASGLRVESHDQAWLADARLADGWLNVTRLDWIARGKKIATGSARLPVPAAIHQWRNSLHDDARPIALLLETQAIQLTDLKDWWAPAAAIDPQAIGRARVSLTGIYRQPKLEATVDLTGLHPRDQPRAPAIDVHLAITGQDRDLRLTGEATAADWPRTSIAINTGWRPLDWLNDPAAMRKEAIHGRIEMPKLELSRLSGLLPMVERMSGSASAQVELAGELGSIKSKGAARITGGTLKLKSPWYPEFQAVAATLDLSPERIVLQSLSSNVAGGSLRANGWLGFARGKVSQIDLRLSGRHLPIVRNNSLVLRSHADLRLSGPWERARLAGQLGVIDSLFYRDIEIIPIGTPFTMPSAAALPKLDAPAKPTIRWPGPMANWGMDVQVRTLNPLLIRGNVATGQIEGAARIGGTIGNPAPNGRFRLKDAVAALPFTTLRIPSGSAEFTPATGFDPLLKIRGTANPRPYQVNVFITGRASDPQLLLTSNPPLPENEIMTLLATGTTSSELDNPQAASTRALQLLAEELRRGRFGVGKQLRPLLRALDKVDFNLAETDPYTHTSFSTATLEIAPRWFLSAGMGAEGDSRILAIWRLTFH